MATEKEKPVFEEKPVSKEEPVSEEKTVEAIEEKAAEEKTIEDNTPEVPSDSELFVGNVVEDLSEKEVFVGDDNLYKFLAKSKDADRSKRAPASDVTDSKTTSLKLPQKELRGFPVVQTALAASIFLIAAMLLYVLFKSPTDPLGNVTVITSPEQIAAIQQTLAQKQPPEDKDMPLASFFPQSEDASEITQPLSLKIAETFYTQKDYEKAYFVYGQLHHKLYKPMMSVGYEGELLRDFLQLRRALCLKEAACEKILQEFNTKNAIEQANNIFRYLSKSRSPVVSLMANYHLAFAEIQKKRYLKARTKAYQVLGLIDAIDFDRQISQTLKSDCHFIIAACLTRSVLALSDTDENIPPQLWGKSLDFDPFVNLNEKQLRALLISGTADFAKALLSPQIKKLDDEDSSVRFSVTSSAASIEELLARFTSKVSFEINWTPGCDSSEIKKRPLTIHTLASTDRYFIPAAAGCVGLIARLDKENVVDIYNPEQYHSQREYLSLLNEQATSLWRQFLILFHNDERIVNGHFSLGLLQAQQNQPSNAIAEYKLVANRFSHTPLAPFALLHSSKQKLGIRDYYGAREDLKQLTEQHPDSQVAAKSYLYLADATMKSGLKSEAAELYGKIYHVGLTVESKTAAALAAGKCFYEQDEYKDAITWFKRYINLVEGQQRNELSLVYMLMGKSYLALGKTHLACDNFQNALAEKPAEKEFIETISAMITGYTEQQKFIQAYDILENIPLVGLSKKATIEVLLLKCKCLRAMGMTDTAIAMIGDRPEYTFDSTLRAQMHLELAKCFLVKENFEVARNNLTKILTFIEPGVLMLEVTLELADLHLKLGKYDQTISICSQLLDLDPPENIRLRTINTLAIAYKNQKKYDKAASVLLGKWDKAKIGGDKFSFNQPAYIDKSFAEAK